MQIGFAGLGRMGGNMVERLRRGGFLCAEADPGGERYWLCITCARRSRGSAAGSHTTGGPL